MTESIRIGRLRTGSVYKLILVGLLLGFFPLFVLLGILGAMDIVTLSWNEQPVIGPKAVVIGPLMGVFFAFIFTAVIGSVVALGLWMFGCFRPLTLEVSRSPEATESVTDRGHR